MDSRRLVSISLAGLVALLLTAFAPAAAAPRTFRDCADCPEMVVVPAGIATIGSSEVERSGAGTPAAFGDREGPAVQVRFARPFALSRTEVTRAQYAAFVVATHRPDVGGCGIHDAATDGWGPKPGYSWHNPGFAQGDDHPVVCISLDDATAYAAWLAKKTGKPYRIPGEAEWEYGARGGTTTAWPWGNSAETGCDQANILSSGFVAALGSPKSLAGRLVCSAPRAFSLPVASFAPNAFGLYDMAGNAFEWVADCYSDSHTAQKPDGSPVIVAGCSKHFLKGGAFHTPVWLTRPAARGLGIPADLHMFTMGIRLARDLDKEPS